MHAQPLFDHTGQLRPGRQYLFGHRDRMDETEDTIRSVRDQRFRYLRNSYPERPYAQHLVYAEQMSTWKELRRLRFEEATMQGRGEQPNLLTPAQRRFLAPNRPAEELYDLHADPHEIKNLASDPAYQADLLRLRAVVDAWQAEVGDLGLIPEQHLIDQWRPAGHIQQTATPTVQLIDGVVHATCATAGASLAWTTDPPNPAYQLNPFARITGDPDTGGRSWKLYTAPLDLPVGTTIWLRAHRIGFRASDDCYIAL
jgi:uncharacterized sulfatase